MQYNKECLDLVKKDYQDLGNPLSSRLDQQQYSYHLLDLTGTVLGISLLSHRK